MYPARERALEASPWHILLLSSPVLVGGFINGFYNPQLFALQPSAFWIADTFQHFIIPLAVLLLLYKFFEIEPSDYGLVKPDPGYPAWEMFGAGVFAAIVLIIVSTVFFFTGYLVFGDESFVFAFNLVVPDNGLKLLVVVYMACTAGFFEEIFYRGLAWKLVANIQPALLRKSIYVLAGSFVFAIMHWEQGLPGVLSSFAFGLAAALFYLQLKNLWPMIVAHILVDIYYFW